MTDSKLCVLVITSGSSTRITNVGTNFIITVRNVYLRILYVTLIATTYFYINKLMKVIVLLPFFKYIVLKNEISYLL
jgi:hypothetical protein